MSPEKEDNFIKDLMSHSGVKMPFDDFEGRLMLKIYREEKTSRSFLKDIKLSWFFFIVGTLFGFVLSIVVGEMNKTIFGFPAQRLGLVIQAIVVIFLLLQFDKLFRLTKKRDIP